MKTKILFKFVFKNDIIIRIFCYPSQWSNASKIVLELIWFFLLDLISSETLVLEMIKLSKIFFLSFQTSPVASYFSEALELGNENIWQSTRYKIINLCNLKFVENIFRVHAWVIVEFRKSLIIANYHLHTFNVHKSIFPTLFHNKKFTGFINYET